MAHVLGQIVVPFGAPDALERAKWAAEKLGLKVQKETPDGFSANKDWWRTWPFNLTVKLTPHGGNETLVAVVVDVLKVGAGKYLQGRLEEFTTLMSAPFG